MVLLSWQQDIAEGWDMLPAIWLSFAPPQLHFAAAAAWPVSHPPTSASQCLAVERHLHLAAAP